MFGYFQKIEVDLPTLPKDSSICDVKTMVQIGWFLILPRELVLCKQTENRKFNRPNEQGYNIGLVNFVSEANSYKLESINDNIPVYVTYH